MKIILFSCVNLLLFTVPIMVMAQEQSDFDLEYYFFENTEFGFNFNFPKFLTDITTEHKLIPMVWENNPNIYPNEKLYKTITHYYNESMFLGVVYTLSILDAEKTFGINYKIKDIKNSIIYENEQFCNKKNNCEVLKTNYESVYLNSEKFYLDVIYQNKITLEDGFEYYTTSSYRITPINEKNDLLTMKQFVTGLTDFEHMWYQPVWVDMIKSLNTRYIDESDSLKNKDTIFVDHVDDFEGGCLIATATYGSEMAYEVQQLREIRDNQLLQTTSGTSFMGMFNDVYYSFSPRIADYERENPMFREAVKLAITPMISSMSIMSYADTESEVVSLGIGIILLNLGMYVVTPFGIIMGLRRLF